MIWILSLGLCLFLALGVLSVANPQLVAPFFAKKWNSPFNQFKNY